MFDGEFYLLAGELSDALDELKQRYGDEIVLTPSEVLSRRITNLSNAVVAAFRPLHEAAERVAAQFELLSATLVKRDR